MSLWIIPFVPGGEGGYSAFFSLLPLCLSLLLKKREGISSIISYIPGQHAEGLLNL